MKTLIVIIIILISVSCASSKQGGCDAYSKVEKTENPS